MKKLYFATSNKQKLVRMQFLARSFSDDFDVLALKQRSNVLLSDSNKQINSKFFKEKL